MPSNMPRLRSSGLYVLLLIGSVGLSSAGCGSRTQLIGGEAAPVDVGSGGAAEPSSGGFVGSGASGGFEPTGGSVATGGAPALPPASVVQVEAGGWHSCALLSTGAVRCWGEGFGGLGYGNKNSIGDDETPASAGDIDLGGRAVSLA